MKIVLQNVDFKEKDRVKALGAKWDPIEKCWYIIDQPDLIPFMDWIPDISKFYKDFDALLNQRKKVKKKDKNK